MVVVSDGSTDRTDQVVSAFPPDRVTLLRLPQRVGKTSAESEAADLLQGRLVVNTDATTRIPAGSLKPLLRAFGDPSVGLASGRDVSVDAADLDSASESNLSGSTRGESGYVGYEMWLRSLETRAHSIVGASGCFYALRRELFDVTLPGSLSRDFASALVTAERGFRAVSVPEAVALVPRARELRVEYRRKVRTMVRGLQTLWFKRRLLSPLRDPLFSFSLMSHKLLRWMCFLVAPLLPAGLAILAFKVWWAAWLFGAGAAIVLVGAWAFYRQGKGALPRLLGGLAFLTSSVLAGLVAWTKALSGERHATWNPTRRS